MTLGEQLCRYLFPDATIGYTPDGYILTNARLAKDVEGVSAGTTLPLVSVSRIGTHSFRVSVRWSLSCIEMEALADYTAQS